MLEKLKFKIRIWRLTKATMFLHKHGYRVFTPKTKSQWVDMADGKRYAILKK